MNRPSTTDRHGQTQTVSRHHPPPSHWVRILSVMVRVCLCLSVAFVFPRVASAEALIRIAVVNFEEVSMSYQTFQNRLRDNDSKKDRVVESVTKENEEIRRMEKDVSSERDPVRVQRLQSIIAQRKVELQTFYYQSMNVLDKERETLISEARKSIYNAIRDIAIQKGFSLVFSENEILYASEDYVDMTADVVQKLNQPKSAKP